MDNSTGTYTEGQRSQHGPSTLVPTTWHHLREPGSAILLPNWRPLDRQLLGRRNFLEATVKFRPGKRHPPGAASANQADVGTQPDDLPLEAAAWMSFFQPHRVSHVQISQHLKVTGSPTQTLGSENTVNVLTHFGSRSPGGISEVTRLRPRS